MQLHLLLLLFCFQYVSARNINIDVAAPWPRHSTSFVLELSEFLFDHSPNSFWQYVEKMCLYSEDVDGVLSVNSESNESDRDRIQKVDSIALAAANEIVQPTMRTLMQTMVNNCFIYKFILSVCIYIHIFMYFNLHFIFSCKETIVTFIYTLPCLIYNEMIVTSYQ
jgi:hypothetical protein